MKLRCFAGCVLVALTACQTDGDQTPPTVVARSPNALERWAIDKPLEVSFSEPILAESSAISVQRQSDGAAVIGATVVSGSQLKFSPKMLELGTRYTVRLNNGIRDLAGNQLAPLEWQQLTRQWNTKASVLSEDAGRDVPGVRVVSGAPNRAAAIWSSYAENGQKGVWVSLFVAPNWQSPVQLSTDIADRYQPPGIAMDAEGHVIAVWKAFSANSNPTTRIMAARFVLGSGWAQPETLNGQPRLPSNPEIAMTPDGKAFVMWSESDGTRNQVKVRQYTPHQGWGVETNVNTAPTVFYTYKERLAYNSNGQALVAWESGGIWVSRFSPTDGWSSPIKISGVASQDILDIHVVSGTSGDLVVWTPAFNNLSQVWACNFTTGMGWGEPFRVDQNVAASTPDVGMDASGRVLVTWVTYQNSRRNLWSRSRSISGRWENPVPVDTGDIEPLVPDLSMNASGQAILLWGESRFDGVIGAIGYAPLTGWEEPEVLIREGRSLPGVAVALDEAGTAYPVWTDPASASFTRGVFASTYSFLK